MSGPDSERVYHRLLIRATDPDTDIWLADNQGFLVQKEIGVLDTRLLPGDYAVEFGLGTAPYPIGLTGDLTFQQAELEKGPTCARRIPHLADDSE
jgi:hypothetical protein